MGLDAYYVPMKRVATFSLTPFNLNHSIKMCFLISDIS